MEELFRGPAAFRVAVKKSDSESKRLQHAFFQPVSLSGALTHQLRSPWYSQAPASRLLWGKAGSSPGHASLGLCGPAFLGLGSSLSITIPHPRVTREALGHSGALNGRFLQMTNRVRSVRTAEQTSVCPASVQTRSLQNPRNALCLLLSPSHTPCPEACLPFCVPLVSFWWDFSMSRNKCMC